MNDKTIIPFGKRPPPPPPPPPVDPDTYEVWHCECGGAVWYALTDGALMCASCDYVADDLSVFWSED